MEPLVISLVLVSAVATASFLTNCATFYYIGKFVKDTQAST